MSEPSPSRPITTLGSGAGSTGNTPGSRQAAQAEGSGPVSGSVSGPVSGSVSGPVSGSVSGPVSGTSSGSTSEGAAKGILVSDSAVAFAKEKLAARGTPDAAVRLGVKGGGCSGFSYVIEFSDDEPRARDRVFEYGGVRFYVDKKSLVILAGTLLDYERTLMFQGFKFKNPQEATSCGCGHSFTVKS